MQSNYIDSDSLVNKEDYKSFEHMYICSICNGIIIDPMQCQKCENCFCNECISSWEKKSTTCPFNCEKFVVKSSKIMKTLLSKMLFNCPNGCYEKIQYQDYTNHPINTCSKIDLKKRYEQLMTQLSELKTENIRLKKAEYKIPNGPIGAFLLKSKYHHHGLLFCHTIKPFSHCQICKEKITAAEGCFYCSFCDFDYCNRCQTMEEANIYH